jgi:hypothetical protein
VQRGHARHHAKVAPSQQLGAEAIVEPRIDHAMLLAREPVTVALHSSRVASISFGRDPHVFATAGLSDGLVKLWTTSPLEQFGASLPGPPSGRRPSRRGRRMGVRSPAAT